MLNMSCNSLIYVETVDNVFRVKCVYEIDVVVLTNLYFIRIALLTF
jgi:hypothetical protein